MSEFNDHILEEAGSRGEKLLVDDLVVLIERHDDRSDGPGVDVDRVRAYADRLDEQGAHVEPDKVSSAIEERLTDSYRWTGDAASSGTWFGSGTLYDVGDGRVSVFPAYWHDELAGETDLMRYLEVIQADLDDSGSDFDSGGTDQGVPETVLLNAASVIGGLHRRKTSERLAELREEGVVEELADQHPNSRVRLIELGT